MIRSRNRQIASNSQITEMATPDTPENPSVLVKDIRLALVMVLFLNSNFTVEVLFDVEMKAYKFIEIISCESLSNEPAAPTTRATQ